MTAPKLLDQVRDRLRAKYCSLCTGQAYVDWIKRFILLFDKRYPREMGADEGVSKASGNGRKEVGAPAMEEATHRDFTMPGSPWGFSRSQLREVDC